MSEPGVGQHIPTPEHELLQSPPARGVSPFGHPRGALRPIPRYPLSLATIEADKILASIKPLNVGGSYPVAQGGIPPIGT